MRRRILRALHAAAALLPHARQGRVTDKGKEQPGSLPSLTYGPVAVPRPTAREAVQLSVVDMSSSQPTASRQPRQPDQAVPPPAQAAARALSMCCTAQETLSTCDPPQVACGWLSSDLRSSSKPFKMVAGGKTRSMWIECTAATLCKPRSLVPTPMLWRGGQSEELPFGL